MQSRSKRDREEEDGPEDEEEGGQDWDSKAKPSQPLSPREYSVWRLRTDKMALEDITGDLPLKVEAWNSPFFQAAALIAVSLKARIIPSDTERTNGPIQNKDTAILLGGTNGIWRMLASQPGVVRPPGGCVWRHGTNVYVSVERR